MDDFTSMLESIGIGSTEEQPAPVTTDAVHFHMPDGVITVPVITEDEDITTAITEDAIPSVTEENTPSSSLSEDDLDEIFADNDFFPEPATTPDESSSGTDPAGGPLFIGDGLIAQLDTDREITLSEQHWQMLSQIREQLNSVSAVSTFEGLDADGHPLVRLPNDELVAIDGIADTAAAHTIFRTDAVNTEATQPEPAPEPEPEPDGTLPLNSPTLLIDNTTSRFSGAEWYNEIQKARIILAGLGGIGSWVALQLARMTPAALYLYDDDYVETVNMAGQLYSRDDVGRSKVSAVQGMISKYTSMQNIFAIQQRFTRETEAGDIMICGFDNMLARREFFNAWQAHVSSLPKEDWKNCLFMDGRLSMTEFQVLCFTGDNDWAMTEYRDKYLFRDEDAEHTVCSLKQTTYLASMIGSVMVNLFTNYIANTLEPVIPYDLPFFTEYNAERMMFNTEN